MRADAGRHRDGRSRGRRVSRARRLLITYAVGMGSVLVWVVVYCGAGQLTMAPYFASKGI